MAKVIKYNLCNVTEEGEEILSPVEMGWNERNEETARMEAHNGEYTIEDDGLPEPEAEATTDDVLNALLGVTV